jgi:hypothetical protein
MHYLASQGLFLSPQFSVTGPDRKQWSSPDFVALDFARHQVQVVEVTTAWDVSGLVKKVEDRKNQWFALLRSQLLQRRVIDDSWTLAVCVFVRKERSSEFTKRFGNAQDVSVDSLEDIVFAWKWPWDEWASA